MLDRALRHLPQLNPSLPVVRRLRRIEHDLVRHLGGPRCVTVPERTLITEVARKMLVCEAMGNWILCQLDGTRQDGTRLATVLVHDGCQRTLLQLLTRLGLAKRKGPRSSFD